MSAASSRRGPPELGGELVDVDRLGEVLVGAGLESLDSRGHLGVGREDEHR
jgi:hypothetical protein